MMIRLNEASRLTDCVCVNSSPLFISLSASFLLFLFLQPEAITMQYRDFDYASYFLEGICCLRASLMTDNRTWIGLRSICLLQKRIDFRNSYEVLSDLFNAIIYRSKANIFRACLILNWMPPQSRVRLASPTSSSGQKSLSLTTKPPGFGLSSSFESENSYNMLNSSTLCKYSYGERIN